MARIGLGFCPGDLSGSMWQRRLEEHGIGGEQAVIGSGLVAGGFNPRRS
jgi:hypothetical protein